MPRFSANLGFLWPDRDLPARIAAAGRAGFKAVELHFPYDVPAAATKAAVAAAGVELLGINTAAGDSGAGLGAVPGREAEFRALAAQAIDYAAEAGGTAVHVMAGRPGAVDHEAAHAVFVQNLEFATAKAAAHGLTILLEPLNPHDMPGYFYHRIEDAADMQDRVGADNLKLMFDAYHVGRAQGDVVTRLRALFDRIGLVQIAAVPSRAEPDEGEIAYRAFSTNSTG
ncbi:MAG TPA: TIM barrel protein [Devosiaceae bacterium]|nr:TIM barrel protein [Devosiaceae bacterium]